MEPNRTRHSDDLASRNSHDRDQEQLLRAAGEPEELDGQLGPDELPDADEVAMNLEAKRHSE